MICDPYNRILFAGDEIRNRLFDSQGTMEEFLFDNFNNESDRKALKNLIEDVRRNKKTSQYIFERDKTTIFVFPANYDQDENLIIATGEPILLANNIESALTERVKELECLYNISNELESVNNTLDEALEKCTGHLARGFQYPQYTIAGILLDGITYGDSNCSLKRFRNSLSEGIIINGQQRGKITVCYQQWAQFLEEERKLLKEISLMNDRAVEKDEINLDLKKQQGLLVIKNEKLTQLTENLIRSNNNLQAFLKAITDTIVVIDADYNITLCNKEEIGISGKCHQKLFGSETRCEKCPAALAFQNGTPNSIERKHDNQYFHLQAYPISQGSGIVDSVLEICSDITEREQIKNHLIQSYKLASLGKLVAGVAHEINNPNTFIRGNIKIIREAVDDILPILDQHHEKNNDLKIARLNYSIFRENLPILLDDMMGGANRIKKIVDGLRNFAKKDEGLLSEDVDVNFLIQNNLRITEKQIRKTARLEVDLCSTVPTFKGSIQRMEQVLMNLLLNASQAIDKENGLITIKTEYNLNNREVLIHIGDNGKGMNEDTRKHIFDPFFTTKRDRGGTGLGLSISYGIVREHHGKITVESHEGSGTIFTITIPIPISE